MSTRPITMVIRHCLLPAKKCGPDWYDFLVVRLLLEQGSNVNHANKIGETPLSLACENDMYTVVSILLEQVGIRVNQFASICGKWYTPLGICIEHGHYTLIELLLKKNKNYDVDVNLAPKYGTTALCLACELGDSFVVGQLLTHDGVDVNSPDLQGRVPFHVACQNGHLEVVKDLLAHGVDVNSPDLQGRVPFHVACQNGHLEVVKVLLAHGVDVNQSVSSDHKTALDVITARLRCANNNEIALTIVYLVFHGAEGVREDIYESWKKSSVVVDGLLSFYNDARAINAFRLCLYRACSRDHVLRTMSMNGMNVVNHIESFLVPSSINARRTIIGLITAVRRLGGGVPPIYFVKHARKITNTINKHNQ